ncbi:GspH/FimT family pseudopilin [Permianibacter aggregans]|uniref:Type II secretion system protein H n=1 Tax=Permianibacter aggregans TaxID=1510150 RepID=A0A4R6USY9_9GAMM|nr:GspH/FimT family pseudopilin [Permianibacter aggregans]TDQ50350.1 type IV fimbrial biogenesis protein FimT [Permianibacter aggregans]
MKAQKGFTLVELMIVIAIAGITLGLGYPSMKNLIIKSRVNGYAHTLLSTVHSARQTAIMRNEYITVCASANGSSCDTDWSKGHLIFIDQNGNRELDIEDTRLNYINGINDADNVKWQSFKIAKTLQFLPTGITNHQNGTFTVCGLGKVKYAKAVIITKTGRPRVSQDSNDDGVDEGASGKPLSCD